jgi:hypothetical protein
MKPQARGRTRIFLQRHIIITTSPTATNVQRRQNHASQRRSSGVPCVLGVTVRIDRIKAST